MYNISRMKQSQKGKRCCYIYAYIYASDPFKLERGTCHKNEEKRKRKRERKRAARSLQYPALSCKSVRSVRSLSPPSGMVTYVKAGYTPRDEWTLFYALLLFNSLASLLHSYLSLVMYAGRLVHTRCTYLHTLALYL